MYVDVTDNTSSFRLQREPGLFIDTLSGGLTIYPATIDNLPGNYYTVPEWRLRNE